MRLPQVSERIKEAPAHALRGVFAGIGQLLLITDKLRNKAPTANDTPSARTPQPAETVTAAARQPAEAATATGPKPAPAAEQAAPGAAAAGVAVSALPLPNYDTLTVASLRARLRNLNADQVRQLASYEETHAARPEVVTMFERRIAKLEAEGGP
ncbi:MAG: hypothetical protein JO132_16700 [Streptosporangiaceae bacterium]|nr:hypothetical protein [Solirubrobacterales bacterium]MBV9095487.1 hypothetical protein [Streptosporangiaceae bacterium]